MRPPDPIQALNQPAIGSLVWNKLGAHGVYPSVTFGTSWGRVLRVVGLAALVLVAGVAAYVQIQQHILRWRAERLLADIREIQMGKSTWADTQRLMYKWGAWGAYEGTCTAKRCDYQIAMEDTFRAMPIYFVPHGGLWRDARMCCRWLRRPYYLLGGRFAIVGARIEVKDGIIWAKSFEVEINTTPHIPFWNEDDYALVGTAHGLTNHKHSDFRSRREYVVWRPNGCEGCKSINVDYSPFADPRIVRSLLDFNLGCLTSFLACREPAELMPTAWRVYGAPAKTDSSGERESTEEEKLEDAGRDSEYASIAEITGTSVTTREDGKRLKWATLRLTQSLKNGVPAGAEVHKWEPLELIDQSKRNGGVRELKKGDRLIALFDIQPDQPNPDHVQNGIYRLIPYTDRNLAAIERGIARDKLADVP